MRYRRAARIALSATLALTPLTAVADAASVDVGKELYRANCRACHGPTAKGLASYPSLRGQSVAYLTDRLERYRAGERFGPNTMLMAPRAQTLSDADILNISTFITSLDQ
ncbi:MAG: c-type cytochrome, partial [Pseudomonadota bacterium]